VLAHVLLEQAAQRHDRPTPRLSPEALAVLRAYDFPGNVRELKNALEHAVILVERENIGPEHLPRALAIESAPGSAKAQPERPRSLAEMREIWLAPLEREYLRDLLGRTFGNVRDAAEMAGVNHVTLYRLLKKRGLVLGRAVRAQ
jgi:DNA-binding NtrC family response regulator